MKRTNLLLPGASQHQLLKPSQNQQATPSSQNENYHPQQPFRNNNGPFQRPLHQPLQQHQQYSQNNYSQQQQQQQQYSQNNHYTQQQPHRSTQQQQHQAQNSQQQQQQHFLGPRGLLSQSTNMINNNQRANALMGASPSINNTPIRSTQMMATPQTQNNYGPSSQHFSQSTNQQQHHHHHHHTPRTPTSNSTTAVRGPPSTSQTQIDSLNEASSQLFDQLLLNTLTSMNTMGSQSQQSLHTQGNNNNASQGYPNHSQYQNGRVGNNNRHNGPQNHSHHSQNDTLHSQQQTTADYPVLSSQVQLQHQQNSPQQKQKQQTVPKITAVPAVSDEFDPNSLSTPAAQLILQNEARLGTLKKPRENKKQQQQKQQQQEEEMNQQTLSSPQQQQKHATAPPTKSKKSQLKQSKQQSKGDLGDIITPGQSLKGKGNNNLNNTATLPKPVVINKVTKTPSHHQKIASPLAMNDNDNNNNHRNSNISAQLPLPTRSRSNRNSTPITTFTNDDEDLIKRELPDAGDDDENDDDDDDDDEHHHFISPASHGFHTTPLGSTPFVTTPFGGMTPLGLIHNHNNSKPMGALKRPMKNVTNNNNNNDDGGSDSDGMTVRSRGYHHSNPIKAEMKMNDHDNEDSEDEDDLSYQTAMNTLRNRSESAVRAKQHIDNSKKSAPALRSVAGKKAIPSHDESGDEKKSNNKKKSTRPHSSTSSTSSKSSSTNDKNMVLVKNEMDINVKAEEDSWASGWGAPATSSKNNNKGKKTSAKENKPTAQSTTKSSRPRNSKLRMGDNDDDEEEDNHYSTTTTRRRNNNNNNNNNNSSNDSHSSTKTTTTTTTTTTPKNNNHQHNNYEHDDEKDDDLSRLYIRPSINKSYRPNKNNSDHRIIVESTAPYLTESDLSKIQGGRLYTDEEIDLMTSNFDQFEIRALADFLDVSVEQLHEQIDSGEVSLDKLRMQTSKMSVAPHISRKPRKIESITMTKLKKGNEDDNDDQSLNNNNNNNNRNMNQNDDSEDDTIVIHKRQSNNNNNNNNNNIPMNNVPLTIRDLQHEAAKNDEHLAYKLAFGHSPPQSALDGMYLPHAEGDWQMKYFADIDAQTYFANSGFRLYSESESTDSDDDYEPGYGPNRRGRNTATTRGRGKNKKNAAGNYTKSSRHYKPPNLEGAVIRARHFEEQLAARFTANYAAMQVDPQLEKAAIDRSKACAVHHKREIDEIRAHRPRILEFTVISSDDDSTDVEDNADGEDEYDDNGEKIIKKKNKKNKKVSNKLPKDPNAPKAPRKPKDPNAPKAQRKPKDPNAPKASGKGKDALAGISITAKARAGTGLLSSKPANSTSSSVLDKGQPKADSRPSLLSGGNKAKGDNNKSLSLLSGRPSGASALDPALFQNNHNNNNNQNSLLGGSNNNNNNNSSSALSLLLKKDSKPKKSALPMLDENGQPIPQAAAKKGGKKVPQLDQNGLPIQPPPKAPKAPKVPQLDSDGNPITTSKPRNKKSKDTSVATNLTQPQKRKEPSSLDSFRMNDVNDDENDGQLINQQAKMQKTNNNNNNNNSQGVKSSQFVQLSQQQQQLQSQNLFSQQSQYHHHHQSQQQVLSTPSLTQTQIQQSQYQTQQYQQDEIEYEDEDFEGLTKNELGQWIDENGMVVEFEIEYVDE